MNLSHLAAVPLAVLAVLGPAASVAAQSTYPPTAENGQVSDTSITPGQCVTFSGDGFAPGTPVQVTDNDQPVTTVDASATGSFSVQVCPEVLGLHILRATGTGLTGGTHTVTATVNVFALSVTGSGNTVPMGVVGAGLVLAGTTAVVVASRRRRRLATS